MSAARRLLMAASGGASAGVTLPPGTWTRGTLTPDGSPVTILDDTKHNAFPGIVWLDSTRCLLVWRRATGHLTGGEIYGKIGTVSGLTVSWGSSFLIYTNAEDVRCHDGVAVIDNQVVVVGRLYNGTANHSPFLIIAADAPASFTSGSSWGSPISIPLTAGAVQNLAGGRMHKLGNGTYAVAYEAYDPTAKAGVLISSSLTNWAAMTVVQIGTPYTELDFESEGGANLRAHVRRESPMNHYYATSSDYGATWTGLTSLYSAWGFPQWMTLTSGMRLAVHRTASSPWETYWRQSADDEATWSAQTLLDGYDVDGAVSDSAYATFLQLDATHALCVYSIEDSSDDVGKRAVIRSQVFADSSTLA